MKRSHKFLFFLSTLLISTLFVPTSNNLLVSGNQPALQSISMQSYTISAPLLITNDGELYAASSSGDGSASTPYVIEGLNISS